VGGIDAVFMAELRVLDDTELLGAVPQLASTSVAAKNTAPRLIAAPDVRL
jgi:hypothetical protein